MSLWRRFVVLSCSLCLPIFLVFGIVMWVGYSIMFTVNANPPHKSQ